MTTSYEVCSTFATCFSDSWSWSWEVAGGTLGFVIPILMVLGAVYLISIGFLFVIDNF